MALVFHLRAIVASPDGKSIVRCEMAGEDPQRLGTAVAHDLLSRGARAS